MKVETYYDIGCGICSRYLSTDFGKGMQYSKQQAIKIAKEVGFKEVNNLTVCPRCFITRFQVNVADSYE